MFVRSAPFGIVIIGTMLCYCIWLEGKIVGYKQTANVYSFDRGRMKFIYANMYKMCILEYMCIDMYKILKITLSQHLAGVTNLHLNSIFVLYL